jgi:hypothetical protein
VEDGLLPRCDDGGRILQPYSTRVDKFDVSHRHVLCRVHRRLGIAEDGHPAVHSLGVIAGLSVPRGEWVLGVNERALRYWREYCRVDDN